jgi:hypothetical protein
LKANPVTLALAAMLAVGCLPWLRIFSGSVTGLQITNNGVGITSMDVLLMSDN